ncbi:MAG TPA: arginine--tRNA ligase [Acholeplasmataceae bacterium]|nr:arginine--tRNA ligase [Acholeplasmataceae bacterium]
MIENILAKLKIRLEEIVKELGVTEEVEIFFEIPKEEKFGDYSTNIAMRLAKHLRKNPREIASQIISKIDQETYHLVNLEVAGGGFINFFLDRKYIANIVFEILKLQEDYGNLEIGKGTNVNLEFVSANPTGYLHIGHGRGAAYGDSLARIMKKAGFEITKEHYVNDGGNQINNLIESIYERYKELFGLEIQMGEDYYYGEEIIEIAKKIKTDKGDFYLNNPYKEDFRKIGVDFLLTGLKEDLKLFNVEFDIWFSEKSLYDSGEVQKTLDYLIEKGHTYEKDGAIWLKTTEYGDEKDRVLVKSDKTLTYLTPDIAYHRNKLSRGHDYLINVFGADHHGYIKRLKAAIAFIGGDPDKVDVEILQMVRVIQNGEELKMSKRSGKAISLRELIDEVGTDALRFMYISKALSSPMDLDLDLAVKKSNENPVYYVQYAYARIASLFRVVEEQGIEYQEVSEFTNVDLGKLSSLLFTLAQYPSVIEEAATKRLPHKITQYLLNLASNLHSYYNDEKIITENLAEVNEKLTIMRAVQVVLKDGLNLIGVSVKEKM